jgi:hypothetical protein
MFSFSYGFIEHVFLHFLESVFGNFVGLFGENLTENIIASKDGISRGLLNFVTKTIERLSGVKIELAEKAGEKNDTIKNPTPESNGPISDPDIKPEPEVKGSPYRKKF